MIVLMRHGRAKVYKSWLFVLCLQELSWSRFLAIFSIPFHMHVLLLLWGYRRICISHGWVFVFQCRMCALIILSSETIRD